MCPNLTIVGDGGVGKTSIVIRYVQNKFSNDYYPTLEDNYTVNIKMNDGSYVEMQIADTAGQEEYRTLRDKYLDNGDVFLVVYSITDSRSLQTAQSMIEEISLIKEGEPFSFILVGNKCDLETQRQVPKYDGESLAKRHGGFFFEASAMTHENIDEIFTRIAYLATADNGDQAGCKCFVR